MNKVKLSDVMVRANTRVDKEHTDLIYYVGGEHFVSGEFKVEQRGHIAGSTIGPMFYYGFKAGQFLLVSRNPHLKKAGVVDFDGICSEKTFVLQTADPSVLLPEYLPLVLQNEDFWEYAVAHKHGSTNFFINWETLANYEFYLPSIATQQKIAKTAWAAYRVKKAYETLLESVDNLVKSQFIEMFGSPVLLDRGWDIKTVEEIATTQLGKMLNAKNQTGQNSHYYLANRNVQWFRIEPTDLRMMDFDEAERVKFALEDGDLLVCEGGEIGRCAIWHGEVADCYIQNAVHRVRCDKEQITPLFLGYQLFYHATENGFSDIVGSKATIAHLPADKLKTMRVMVPPLAEQHTFEDLVEQSDKSKSCFQRNSIGRT